MSDYKELYPLDISPQGDTVKEAVLKNRDEIKNLGKEIGLMSSGGGSGFRNRVLAGKTSNGQFNYLTGNGLSITIDGSTVPVLVTFANGFNDKGAIDYLSTITTKVSAWSVPSYNTSYLYVERSNLGGLSYDSTTIKPVSSNTIPIEATTGACYYNTLEQKMYKYNGVEWQAKQIVFVASVTTNGTDVETIAYWESDDNSFIPKHSITTDMYKAQSVDTSALSDNSVTADKLSDNSVTADKLSDNSVTADKLSDNSVTADKLADDVSTIINNVLDKAWPVGAIYTSTVPTNPNTLFGFGMWEYIEQGRVLLSQGSSYPVGSTGGSATHTLSVSEIPSHNHESTTSSEGGHTHDGTTSSNGNHSHTVPLGDGSNDKIRKLSSSGSDAKTPITTSTTGYHDHTFTTSSNGTHTHTISISNTGSGAAHNNMQPYLSVYMWERTA